jgi:hypothetical protein
MCSPGQTHRPSTCPALGRLRDALALNGKGQGLPPLAAQSVSVSEVHRLHDPLMSLETHHRVVCSAQSGACHARS